MKNLISLTFLSALLFLQACGTKEKKQSVIIQTVVNPYVQSFTSGVVSSLQDLEINLTQEVPNVEVGESVKGMVTIVPKVSGNLIWKSKKSIVFHPKERLKSGEVYQVHVNLAKVYTEVASEHRQFKYSFQVVKRNFEFFVSGVFADEATKDRLKVQGYVTFSDVEKVGDLKNFVRADHQGISKNVRWESTSDDKRWRFTIADIQRMETESQVTLTVNGQSLGIKRHLTKTVKIPAVKSFRLMNIRAVQKDDQYILLEFSDLIDAHQDFNGMVEIQGVDDLRYVVQNSLLKVYFGKRLSGAKQVSIYKGILSDQGKSLSEDVQESVQFAAVKPNIRFVGKGVIVPPTGKGAIISFETVNLNAVDLYVIKIYEKNIPQFLQESRLNGSSRYETVRTGRMIKKEKIDLLADHVLQYGRWNAFSFDLSDMVKTEPGALYLINLRMKKSYSTYPCQSADVNDNVSEFDFKMENWDKLRYWPPYSDYNWKDRENPCKISYYNTHSASRNVLVSDFGILSKKDVNDNYRLYVNSLASAKPISGAEVSLLDFQGVGIVRGKTNGEGKVELSPSRTPYLALVEQGNQKGYLRLDAGSSLSYSNFDVSGTRVQKGIKGFLYGERGVWRPGDSIYINFILEDKLDRIPDNHPVEFTLSNPQGQVTKRLVSTSGLNGFYPFHVKTAKDAPTGNWSARVQVGDAQFFKRVRVETVKPNRLKIKLDFGSDTLDVAKKMPPGKIKVAWLHGAKARNMKVVSEVSFKTGNTKFANYPNYVFTDASKSVSTSPETIFEGTTDSNGEVSLNMKRKIIEHAPGFLQARFFTRAFESGGDFSSSVKTLTYSQFTQYVGVKSPALAEGRYYYDTNKKYTFDIATVDAQGNPVDVDNISVRLVKVSWRWWWSSNRNSFGNYSGRNSYTAYLTKKVRSVNGKASVALKVDKNDWGRYLLQISIPNGHSTGRAVFFDWPYGNRKDGPGGATQLVFSADKKKYEVGEDIQIKLPGGDGARALVSIENGSKIVQDSWVDLKSEQNTVVVKSTPEMAPNVYINVMLIQPHANTLNDNPIRMYGAVPVLVEDPSTILKPVLKMPKVLRPEKEVRMAVSEQNGKAMTYTIAVVDEGLLDLTNYHTPQPHKVFYAREALGVRTWDIYDQVSGAYGGRIEKMFAIGGDGELLKDSKKKANRFKPVAKLFGPFSLDKGTQQIHTFTMPRYVGSVRTMVVAGDHGAYGNAEVTTPVRNPLMVTATLPRVLGPGETVKLPVSVFAMEKSVKKAKVTITTEGGLVLNGEESKSVTFSELGEEVIWFDVDVKQILGIGKVHVLATSGKHIAKYDIELDIRHPNTAVTKSKTIRLAPGESVNEQVTLPGIDGTNELTVEVSSIVPLNLSGRLDQLIRYPYGCVEQTTSSIFPQLYLTDLLKLSDARAQRIEKNVKDGLKRLQKFQNTDGGFTYWPGRYATSEWGTNYAGHFIVEAEKAGYILPTGMKTLWLRYQKKAANTYNRAYTGTASYGYKQQIQAYRLYTLALAGEPQFSAMNRLKTAQKLSKQSKWRLALAYAHAGRPETALELIDVRDLDVEDYVEMKYTYGSAFRDRAMLLETLTSTKMQDEAWQLLKQISEVLNSDRWLNTQETAWALCSVAKFYKVNKPAGKSNSFALKVGEHKAETGNLDQGIITREYALKGVRENVSFTNKGEGVLFVTLAAKGIPAIGEETASAKHITLGVQYLDNQNRALNVGSIKQGTDFKAVVTVNYDGINKMIDNLALNQIFPSGWEILNARLYTGESNQGKVLPDYQDIRDDRVHTFFSLPKGKTATFELRLNASYAGRYYLPQVTVEAMYSNAYYARNKGRWVKVLKDE